MHRSLVIMLTAPVAACAAETRSAGFDRSQFNVVRGGVNLDALALACAKDPRSVGFETSQACFSALPMPE